MATDGVLCCSIHDAVAIVAVDAVDVDGDVVHVALDAPATETCSCSLAVFLCVLCIYSDGRREWVVCVCSVFIATGEECVCV